ncbi:hypothetical protein BGW80DRAFT_1351934, partial [Lactifluus volemus]
IIIIIIITPSIHSHQILFLGGPFLITGPQKTFYFFARRNKLRILLVFLKWPAIGVLVEMFGFLGAYALFWPCLRPAPSLPCHRCMASTLAYAVSHFPARLYNKSLPTHTGLSLFALDSLIGCPPTDHRLWPGAAPRF